MAGEVVRDNSNARGYGSAWQRARLRYLKEKPFCAYCEKQGRITVATVVDHITPHKGDKNLFWDPENWQPLCATHHSAAKQREEHAGAPREIGADGWPIE